MWSRHVPGSFLAGHYSTSGTTRHYSTNGTTGHYSTSGNPPSADRVADEERGGVSRSGDSPRKLGRGLDTCPARPSPGTTRPTEPQGATRPAGTHTSADRVADEERGGVSRSGDSPRRPGRGLDTCPARPSPGTTRPTEPQGTTRPAEPRGTTRPAEPQGTTRPAEESLDQWGSGAGSRVLSVWCGSLGA